MTREVYTYGLRRGDVTYGLRRGGDIVYVTCNIHDQGALYLRLTARR